MGDNTISFEDIQKIASEQLIGISDNKQLRKFYSQWSVNASKLIKKYAAAHSLEWYNTKWRQKSTEIPFYIRTKAPRSFLGNIWFASRPTNYAFAKGVPKYKTTRKAIPKNMHVKPVKAYGRWFKPKKYCPDIESINASLTEQIENSSRMFATKTTHNGTRKYKRPLVWFQNHKKDIGLVNLKEQLSDHIAEDPDTYQLILQAFAQTVADKKYL